MAASETKRVGWFPLRGSWEEAVLSWNEQVDQALRRQQLNASPARNGKGNLVRLDLKRLPREQEENSSSVAA